MGMFRAVSIVSGEISGDEYDAWVLSRLGVR